MSGPNQHHIPQFYQRPFGVKPKGKKPKEIWRHVRGEAPSLRPISKTASEDEFYSKVPLADEETLDRKITRVEKTIADSYHLVRVLPIGSAVDGAVAAELVTHLAPRSSHLRTSMASAFQQLTRGARDVFTDPNQFEQLLGLENGEPTDRFRSHFRGALSDRPDLEAVGLPVPVLERAAFYIAKEQFDVGVEHTVKLFTSMLTHWSAQAAPMARDSHNEALGKLADGPNPRRDHLAAFDWRIVAAPGGAILPDCVALAYAPGAPALPMIFVGRDMDAIVMPLAKDKLLVGHLPSVGAPDVTDFNKDAAACSQEFFLADNDGEDLAKLNALIGTRAEAYFEDAMRSALKSFMPETRLEAEDELEAAGDLAPRESDLQFSCDIQCYDFGDPELHKLVADATVPIIQGLAKHLPLSRLDGITFAVDYPAALAAIDRGREDLPPATTKHADSVGGLGRTVTVMREGKPKGRLIFNAPVVECLISEDPGDTQWAIQMLVHQLALVAMIELIERALPGTVLQPVEDGFQSALYREIHDALEGYVAARFSALFADKVVLTALYRERLIGALHAMKAEVEQARTAYAMNQDMERLLSVAMPAVNQVLFATAELLGQCETSGEPILDSEGALFEALQNLSLLHWSADYGKDLLRFYGRLGGWRSIDEFLAFNRHVERVLWSVGLFPWQSEEGDRVEVLLSAEQMALVGQG